jgi:hypothetical protein
MWTRSYPHLQITPQPPSGSRAVSPSLLQKKVSRHSAGNGDEGPIVIGGYPGTVPDFFAALPGSARKRLAGSFAADPLIFMHGYRLQWMAAGWPSGICR